MDGIVTSPLRGLLVLNVIRFLEKMGCEAQWGEIAEEEMELALSDAKVRDSLRPAILHRDVTQLLALLHQDKFFCTIIPGEEEEEEEEQEREGEDESDQREVDRP